MSPEEIEKRKQYLALWEKSEELNNQSWALRKPIWDAMQEATKPLEEDFRRKMVELEKPFRDQVNAITDKHNTETEAIHSQMEALGLGDRLYNEDYSHAFVCEITGLPVFKDDDIIQDQESGDVILRFALPSKAVAE